MSASIDTVVIGAGVVGLAVARALALAGREVVVLEKNGSIGEETSARSSEVIHAGLYYPRDSLKARLCVAGRELLYSYCATKGIPHRRCGKLLVASAAQRMKLDAVQAAAVANGVTDLEWLAPADLQRMEPAVAADIGLWSPSTGIVDSHALMLALRGDLEAAGGHVATHSRLVGIETGRDGLTLRCTTGADAFELAATTIVNAGGLHATRVAALLGAPAETIPPAVFAKGHYFSFAGRSPFTHLVYPVPEDGGLGIHATLDLAGRARFGPDVEWLPTGTSPEALDYAVPAGRAATFYRAIRTYWPELPDGSLEPAYAGVRPKISAAGEPAADFAVRLERRGATIVHLFGIESPGLTSSLALGEHVSGLLAGTPS